MAGAALLPSDCSGEVYDCLLDVFPRVLENVVGFDVELGFIVSAFFGSAEVVNPTDVLLESGEGALRHLLRRRGLDAVVQP